LDRRQAKVQFGHPVWTGARPRSSLDRRQANPDWTGAWPKLDRPQPACEGVWTGHREMWPKLDRQDCRAGLRVRSLDRPPRLERDTEIGQATFDATATGLRRSLDSQNWTGKIAEPAKDTEIGQATFDESKSDWPSQATWLGRIALAA
jgi:hypothetical protein